MNRQCALEDISDGRLYTENDMVKVDTGGCKRLYDYLLSRNG